jgi:hypothetical protein
VPDLFHVTSVHNRESVERYGLDWTRMGALLGFARSVRPAVNGVFLCRDRDEVEFFCRPEALVGPVDIWAVEGIDLVDLVEARDGFLYSPTPIPAGQLRLVEGFRMPEGTGPYKSTLTLIVDDGRVLQDEDARALMRDERAWRPDTQ